SPPRSSSPTPTRPLRSPVRVRRRPRPLTRPRPPRSHRVPRRLRPRARPPRTPRPRRTTRPDKSSRADALDHLVRGIVDDPDAVRVTEKSTRRGPLLEVRVGAADLGRVIGRSGSAARALRQVTTALSAAGVRGDIAVRIRLYG